jgi:serine/threonine protein phosphatase PrpC
MLDCMNESEGKSIREIFSDAFLKADKEILKNFEVGGSSAVVAFITRRETERDFENWLYIANLGTCKAVLRCDNI